ncbi:MAG: PHP domain-containing protein [Myxococcaceae bacterium]
MRWLFGSVLGLFAIVVGRAGLEGWQLASPDQDFPSPPGVKRQIRGAYHVHSSASDGRRDVAEIALQAARARLDFVILTDHNPTELPRPRREQGVLLLFEQELSTPYGHVVALGVSAPLRDSLTDQPIRDIQAAGGVALLAHPIQRRNPWRDVQAAQTADGLELISGDTDWRNALASPWATLLPALGASVWGGQWGLMAMSRPDPGVREWLLGMSDERTRLSPCALDAHGWPSYEAAFRTWANFLPRTSLPDDAEQAAREILSEFRKGTTFCGVPSLAPPDGFAVFGSADGSLRVGEEVRLQIPAAPGWESRVDIHGAATWHGPTQTVRMTRPGLWLAEVWVRRAKRGGRWVPWIVASPVRVR